MTIGALIARQRSGTGALGSVLDQQPDISYLGEVFHHDATDSPPNYFWFFRSLVRDDPEMALPGSAKDRFERYADFLAKRKNRVHTIIDVKYSSLHHFNSYWLGVLEPPGLIKILREQKSPIIHLRRKNSLKAFVSGCLAELNNEWHAKSLDAIKIRRLTVDHGACIRFIDQQSREVEYVTNILKGYPKLIELEYAELFDGAGELKEAIANRLAEFFGVARFARRKPPMVKQTLDSMMDVIENYGEIELALSNTPYSWMLRDD